MDYIQPQFKGDYFNCLYEYGLNLHHNYKSITIECIKKIFKYVDKIQLELDTQTKLINIQTVVILNLKEQNKNENYDNLKFKYNELLKEYKNYRKKTNKNIRKNNDTDKSNNLYQEESPPAYDFV